MISHMHFKGEKEKKHMQQDKKGKTSAEIPVVYYFFL